jgi:hypothetical protein
MMKSDSKEIFQYPEMKKKDYHLKQLNTAIFTQRYQKASTSHH